jgi:hypothetical protein
MEQLIEFGELQKVLADLANDIRDNYREHLEFNNRFTTERKLLNSVRTQVEVDDRAFEVTMSLEDYWKYVEEGVQGSENGSSPFTNPGWKAYPFILRWVQIKPVIPRPFANGRLPTPKQLGFLITRSIVEKGTQGSHDLEKVKEGVLPWYRERIATALGHDMTDYIRKVIVGK